MPHHHVATRLTPAITALLASTLVAQTEWTQLTPSNTPVAFTAHAMAYYLPTDTTVLFGGTIGGVRYDQTWLWTGGDWTQAFPSTVPPARVAHSMAYDEFRGRLVMYGGIDANGGTLGDTWEWDGSDWLPMTPANSPGPRRSHPLAFLPTRGTVILWGGYFGADFNDTWEWNGSDWTQIVTTNAPSPRRASDMAYDPVNQGLLLFSGYQQTNDTWVFDGTDWTQLLPATSPSARYDHSMVTDRGRDRIVTFGGPGAADQWEWDGTNWLQRTPATLPSARSDTYLAYDQVREEVLMFGSSAVPETWRYAVTNSASFTTMGSGCPGTLGQAPVLSSTMRPWIDTTFAVDVGPVPANTIVLMVYGLSDTVSSVFGALPVSLASLGMPGCTLQVDSVLVDAFVAVGISGTWLRPLPDDAALLGRQIFCQGAALDLGANAFGAIVADHGVMTIGGK
ncbi:MAG: hypothetical protein H6835_01260 [Planctomycetes bacterium]|nr:hypothetical protein [Planctomycetota bacterium]